MSPTAQKWTATPDLNARNEEDTRGKKTSVNVLLAIGNEEDNAVIVSGNTIN